jgi:hypothetical protein
VRPNRFIFGTDTCWGAEGKTADRYPLKSFRVFGYPDSKSGFSGFFGFFPVFPIFDQVGNVSAENDLYRRVPIGNTRRMSLYPGVYLVGKLVHGTFPEPGLFRIFEVFRESLRNGWRLRTGDRGAGH